MRTLAFLTAFLLSCTATAAQHSTETYKTVGERELKLHIVSPDDHATT